MAIFTPKGSDLLDKIKSDIIATDNSDFKEISPPIHQLYIPAWVLAAEPG
jgi:hypothetical protein